MNSSDIFNPKNKKFWSIALLLLLGIMLMLLGSCESGMFSRARKRSGRITVRRPVPVSPLL